MAQTDADLDAEKGEKQTDLIRKCKDLADQLWKGHNTDEILDTNYNALDLRLMTMNENKNQSFNPFRRKEAKYPLTPLVPDGVDEEDGLNAEDAFNKDPKGTTMSMLNQC